MSFGRRIESDALRLRRRPRWISIWVVGSCELCPREAVAVKGGTGSLDYTTTGTQGQREV